MNPTDSKYKNIYTQSVLSYRFFFMTNDYESQLQFDYKVLETEKDFCKVFFFHQFECCYVAGMVWIVCLMIKVLKHNSNWLRRWQNLEQSCFKKKTKYIRRTFSSFTWLRLQDNKTYSCNNLSSQSRINDFIFAQTSKE